MDCADDYVLHIFGYPVRLCFFFGMVSPSRRFIYLVKITSQISLYVVYSPQFGTSTGD